jgi:type III pantothenate kinase
MSKKQYLVLDIGNTHTKYGYFEANTLKDSGICSDWSRDKWASFHQKAPFTIVLVGTVGASTKQTLSLLPESCDVAFIDDTTKYPFTTAYDDINSLGIDRRAALSGAMATHPNTAVLVIDAGSCITYDFMDASGHHAGGAISLGRAMRYGALHMFTANLPLLDPTDVVPAIGTSTSTSMSLGVEAGVISEIHAHIEAFTQKFGDFTIILTGGDTNFLIKNIKYTIFANAELILIGLQNLLMFNTFHEK